MTNLFRSAKVLFFSLILMTVLMISNNSSAQINVGGTPISSMTELNDVFSSVTMPLINTDRLKEEDLVTEKIPGMPFRFGYNFEVNYNLNNSGTWQELPDGSRVWRLAVRSADAVSLNLAFRDFHMPKGGTFFVYNLAKTMVYGAFTEINNSADGYFATTPTYGSTTVLEYYEPVYSRGQGSITLFKVTHAYKDIFGYNSVLEEPCNININCPIGGPWVEQKRSVTRITFSQGTGSFLCSGSLINNTLGDRQPYYLFAEHCATDNYSTIVFYYNYENPTCIGTLGSLAQTMTGATLKASNFDTDFRLVLLNQSVPGTFNAYYNGWDRSNAQPLNETAIHHPGGAVKKISVDNQPANTVTGFGGRLVNGFWLVVWDEGMTEGGSSGCPIFDQNHRVIGQNLGGTAANCANPQSVQKYFGKFSESWAHGGNSSNQLKDWLDPNNSGVLTVDGIDDVTGIAPVTNFTSNIQVIPIGGGSVDFFDLTTNGPTSWTWSFPGATPSTSSDRNPGGIAYTATGNYTVSLTTSNAFGGNMKTAVAYIKVEGVPLSTFTLQSPPSLTTIIVNSNDPTPAQFTWRTSNPDPSVKYRFKIKKVGTTAEDTYLSNNNGTDTVMSLRKSFLDSLAASYGTNGDSVLCAWRVTASNGADSVTANSFIITLKRQTVGINQISSVLPERFSLYNNYPNPFNPTTNIKFDIIKNDRVTLSVYNVLGEKVSTLVDQDLAPGSYTVDFNAAGLSSGMYFYRLETRGYSETKRMALVK
ncbi:MAG: T9SS type A sorting domain-containing protein [Bacteroidetes bacterium]|nr:T9SS type A sorting domain-containing protein [Bacteroidota bacterium]